MNQPQARGGANVIQTLLEHGPIDDFRLWIFPRVLGKVAEPVRC